MAQTQEQRDELPPEPSAQEAATLTVTAELSAMALDMPDVPDHPNKMPFKGVLTFVDQPSDAPPGGSKGRRTIIPRAVAAAMLPSLIGMPVDFAKNFDKHNKRQKIGTITAAHIDPEKEGNAVHIEGFFFAADFPDECAQIKAEKKDLGFSYEIQAQFTVEGGLIRVVGGAFTGAAVLYKDKAAYQSTSLAAQAAGEFEHMTKEELAALIAEAVKPLADQVTALQKTTSGALDANKETRDRIATHANALRACASGMEAAGIGLHGTHGHVAHLNRMAASMEAEAASGKVPHIYRDHDWVISAGAELRQFEAGATPAVDLSKDPTMKALTDSLAKLTTQVTDLSAARFQASQEPARRTLHTEHLALLRKTGLTVEDGKKISVSDLDAAAEKAGLPRQQSIALKLAMQASGHLDA